MASHTHSSTSNKSSSEKLVCGAGSTHFSHPESSDTRKKTFLVLRESEKLIRGADSVTIFDPESCETRKNTVLAVWECTKCGRLHVDPVANPNCMPTPPTTDCVTRHFPSGSCQYKRLDHFCGKDLTGGQISSVTKLEILHMCNRWNGVCTRRMCLPEGEHYRFEHEKAASEEVGTVRSKRVGPKMTRGSYLLFWHTFAKGASVL